MTNQRPKALKDCHHCTCPCTHTGKDCPVEIPCPEFRGIFPPNVGEVHIRKTVRDFALLMEIKLRKNEHKGVWSKCNQEYLLTRLDEEVRELHECFFFYSPGDMNFFIDAQHEDKIPGEAADVANIAMMLWIISEKNKGSEP